MNTTTNITPNQNLSFVGRLIDKSLTIILTSTPIILGSIFVLRFLFLIDKTDVFQEMAFNTQGLIFIFMVFIFFVLVVGYILFIPSLIFIIFSWMFESDKDAIPLPTEGLIINSLLASLFYLFLIFLFSYISHTMGFELSFCWLFFIYFIVLCIISCKYKEKMKLVYYQKILNKTHEQKKCNYYLGQHGKIFIFFLKRKLKFIILTFISSIVSMSPILLILPSIEGGNQFRSWLLLLGICVCPILLSYVPAFIYYRYCVNKSAKRSFVLISVMSIITATILLIFPNSLFIKGFEKTLIINKNQYNAIINENINSKDIFSDNEWKLQNSANESYIYHVKGEKIFNIASNVLYCPPGAYQKLLNNLIYNLDEQKSDTEDGSLQNYTNACVVLDTKQVTFKKILPQTMQNDNE